jgi:hypothetical protein
MKTIALTRGKVALIDDGDYGWATQWKWAADKRVLKSGVVKYYAVRQIHRRRGKSSKVYLHRAILCLDNSQNVDHRDSDGLNCQRHNLRIATYAQNNANTQVRAASRFKGVNRLNNRWRARITVDYREIYLGLFRTAEDAARAYDAAARLYQGEFAQFNLPAEEQL